MKYALRYTLTDTSNKFKARLLRPDEQAPEGVQHQTLEFDADNDEAACKHVMEQIAVPEGNDRSIANLKRVVSLSRPKIERKPRAKAAKPILDLNSVQEPIAGKLFDALTPMINSGELTEDNLKIYVNTSAPAPVQQQVVNERNEVVGVLADVIPQPAQETPQEALAQPA